MGLAQPETELLISDGARALEAAYCAKPPLHRENSRQRTGTGSSVDIKIAVLIWLALQNSVHTLVLRYSRARDVREMYFPSVAVFLTEIFKVLFCLKMITWESKGPMAALQKIKTQVINEPRDTIKVCIPSMLYIVQNNLFYVAASHLDAAPFMIVSQLKTFSAAVFSILMLNRTLSRAQWCSLVVLFVGVSLVQMQQKSSAKSGGMREQNPMLGFAAASVACLLSGFSGVFFEKILKGTAPVSLWMRNVQMAIFAIPASLMAAFAKDGPQLSQHGMLYGFDWVVWLAVIWYGIGGLSVAVCIKYADNIAKDFATAVAILIATLASVYLFDFAPNMGFLFGATLVIFSIFLYSSAESLLHLVRKMESLVVL